MFPLGHTVAGIGCLGLRRDHIAKISVLSHSTPSKRAELPATTLPNWNNELQWDKTTASKGINQKGKGLSHPGNCRVLINLESGV